MLRQSFVITLIIVAPDIKRQLKPQIAEVTAGNIPYPTKNGINNNAAPDPNIPEIHPPIKPIVCIRMNFWFFWSSISS